MYQNIVSEATFLATLTIGSKSFALTMVGDIDQSVSSKYVANGTRVKVPVAGLAEFKNVTVSAPYDSKISPDLIDQCTKKKGTNGHQLRIAVDANDKNPRICKVMILGVKAPGMNADGNSEAKVQIELAPYELAYTVASESNKGKNSTKAQGEAVGSGEVASISSTLADILNPAAEGAGIDIAGLPFPISL
jgi:hypothetical protein